MRAVWLENRVLSFREDVPMPELLKGEALVKVRLAGICGTDLELVKGYYPYRGIPGHEFVGEIVQAPAAPRRIGQRVVADINVACGECPDCRAARHGHCQNRRVLGIKNRNGAFADYLSLPLPNLIPIPETVSDEAAVFAEPLAAAQQIQQQIQIGDADSVLVIGAGRLGQLIAQTLTGIVGQLTVVARYQSQQALLTEHEIDWIREDGIRERAFDIVIEATGSPAGFALARQAVRPRGTIVLKSTYQDTDGSKWPVQLSSLVVDEITLVGSRCGPMAAALAQLEKQQVDPTGLIAKRYFLNDALAAFKHAAAPGALKILLQIKSQPVTPLPAEEENQNE
ncbi:MAG: alcohol dehydrogenase catalytic domain-containing protein [Deltaproteobacteria bacterium]|jgi:threonine dehydrogenase-like Zn-dependent dehydrogenase|nr:alcohol dehydrogenase catalytic domain-containing protein [Deltaproteobacteria bacterium]MBW2487106.1 alcohol dehydrogenase catalytic domain-containing protein [Deltaproteobacteria bacterium]MBW2518629.1 alcohol dehydrogenase catalytic domain-containing protein [Deltaproteobacteria bacterium]